MNLQIDIFNHITLYSRCMVEYLLSTFTEEFRENVDSQEGELTCSPYSKEELLDIYDYILSLQDGEYMEFLPRSNNIILNILNIFKMFIKSDLFNELNEQLLDSQHCDTDYEYMNQCVYVKGMYEISRTFDVCTVQSIQYIDLQEKNIVLSVTNL